MDLLVEAMNKEIMTEAECDQFILDVKTKGSKLPCNSMKEFAKMDGIKPLSRNSK